MKPKARLVKTRTEEFEHNIEQSHRDRPMPKRKKHPENGKFNPIRQNISKKDADHLEALDAALARAIDAYQDSLDNPDKHTDKAKRRLKKKAIACAERIKAYIESLNQKKPSRKIEAFFYREADQTRKKDCKLPKRTGYGLRVPQKNNNPKRGRAVLPLTNPAYVTHRKGPSPDKLDKPEKEKTSMHTGYIFELPGYKKNGNGSE